MIAYARLGPDQGGKGREWAKNERTSPGTGRVYIFLLYFLFFLFQFKSRFEFQIFKVDAQTNSSMVRV
jgi:hypothetical protein